RYQGMDPRCRSNERKAIERGRLCRPRYPCGSQRGGPRGKPGFPRESERAASAARKAKEGRPGRCYRAANVLVGEILRTLAFPGKKRGSGIGRKFRKIREAAAPQLDSEPLGWHVDRRLGAAGERQDHEAAG